MPHYEFVGHPPQHGGRKWELGEAMLFFRCWFLELCTSQSNEEEYPAKTGAITVTTGSARMSEGHFRRVRGTDLWSRYWEAPLILGSLPEFVGDYPARVETTT